MHKHVRKGVWDENRQNWQGNNYPGQEPTGNPGSSVKVTARAKFTLPTWSRRMVTPRWVG